VRSWSTGERDHGGERMIWLRMGMSRKRSGRRRWVRSLQEERRWVLMEVLFEQVKKQRK